MTLAEKLRYYQLPVFAPDAPTSPNASAGGSGDASSDASGASSSSAPSTAPGGGTPSPSTEVLPTPDAGDGADSSPFEFMFTTPEEGGPDVSPPAVKPAPKTEPKPAPAQPEKPAEVKPPEPAKPAATATPEKTEPTSPASAIQTPTLDPSDPGALASYLQTNEAEAVKFAAEQLFKLSDKDVEDIEADVVGTIPRLLAKTFVVAQRNFLQQMAALVPQMVQKNNVVMKRHAENEEKFYTRWPDIKKDQHHNLVMQYASVFRQMNPEATAEDMIEALGPMIMMKAKITPTVPGAQPAASPAARTSPMAPATNGRSPQPTPFVPAGPSAGGASSFTKPDLSPVEALIGPSAPE